MTPRFLQNKLHQFVFHFFIPEFRSSPPFSLIFLGQPPPPSKAISFGVAQNPKPTSPLSYKKNERS